MKKKIILLIPILLILSGCSTRQSTQEPVQSNLKTDSYQEIQSKNEIDVYVDYGEEQSVSQPSEQDIQNIIQSTFSDYNEYKLEFMLTNNESGDNYYSCLEWNKNEGIMTEESSTDTNAYKTYIIDDGEGSIIYYKKNDKASYDITQHNSPWGILALQAPQLSNIEIIESTDDYLKIKGKTSSVPAVHEVIKGETSSAEVIIELDIKNNHPISIQYKMERYGLIINYISFQDIVIRIPRGIYNMILMRD